MDPNRLDNLDRMIDTALSRYSEATPLDGLEQRVLNRIRLAESSRRGFRWLGFGLAFATVLLLVAIGLRTRPTPIAPQAPALAGSALNVPAAPLRSRFRISVRRVHRVRSLPKERMFPTLAPLSREERSLLAYVRLKPFEITGTPTSQPIEIEAIQIQPLQ